MTSNASTTRHSDDEDARAANSTRPAKRAAPPLDPKIIDDSTDSDSDSNSDAPGTPAQSGLPLRHATPLGVSHARTVTSMSLEPSGNRLATASVDGHVKLWDLHTMDTALRPFRQLDALDAREVSFCPRGARLLLVGGGARATLADRDGAPLARTVAGDMYLVDPLRTKGHTAPITSAVWRTGGTSAFTAGDDSTLRLWDFTPAVTAPRRGGSHLPEARQLSVVKLRAAASSGTKAPAVAATALQQGDADAVAVACMDATLKVFDARAPARRAAAVASLSGREPAGVAGAAQLLAARAEDTLLLFDTRRLSEPLAVFTGLPTRPAGVIFASPGAAHVLAAAGDLRIFCTRTLRALATHTDPGRLSTVLWSSAINQVVVGGTDGAVHILHDEDAGSVRGVLPCLVRPAARRQHGFASVGTGPVLTGRQVFAATRRGRLHHLLSDPEAAEQNTTHKRPRVASNQNTASTDPPLPGSQGNGPSHPPSTKDPESVSLTRFVDKQAVSDAWKRDPRQAILSHAGDADANPVFTAAYRDTQPVKLLAEKTEDQEEEERRQAIQDRDIVARQKRFQDRNKNSHK